MREAANLIVGIVEGFYGVFYTAPERNDLIQFIGSHGFNWYLYGPKNDRQHRARWWEVYPEIVMADFAKTVQVAKESGVRFCYSISPGGSICYSCPEDFEKLVHKFQAFYQIGVRDFALLYDDNEPVFRHKADSARYFSLSHAQADLANRVLDWMRKLDRNCTLSVCPVDYHGSAPFGRSLHVLGQELRPEINLFYTGPEIVPSTLTGADARQFTDATFRKPVIWENYPVNDLTMQAELHMGPYSGRSADLPRATRGILANLMVQAEASKIPLLTLADFWRSPAGYDPAQSWAKAIETVAGEEYASAVQVMAENTVYTVLKGFPTGQKLAALAEGAYCELREGLRVDDSTAVRELESYLMEIDEATYTIKFRMGNLALRNNLLPWIDVLEHWMWMTRFSLQVMRAIEQNRPYMSELKRVHEYRELISSHPKRVAGQPLQPLVELILKRVEQDQRRRVSLEWTPSAS